MPPLGERILNCEAVQTDSTCVLGAEPGGLDIKDANLVLYFQFTYSNFKLASMT